jgi:hypothetical protein
MTDQDDRLVVPRDAARDRVRPAIDQVLTTWRQPG